MKLSGVYGGIILVGLVVTSTAQAKYYGGDLCAYPEFKCIKVKRGDSWRKLFPNEKEREWVKRLNRMNVPVNRRPWIVVPTDFNGLTYLDLSPFPRELDKPTKRKIILVDLSDQAFGAYNKDGELVYWGPISGGKAYCSDTESACVTVTGSFTVSRKQGPECVSSKFPLETNGGAPMPYCMHFHRGFAMHGAELPGHHASHGCVRLFQADAKWLNHHFAKIGTPVLLRQ